MMPDVSETWLRAGTAEGNFRPRVAGDIFPLPPARSAVPAPTKARSLRSIASACFDYRGTSIRVPLKHL